MNRYLLVKVIDGVRTSYGTVLHIPQWFLFLTENPLTPTLGTEYFISPTGLAASDQKILLADEQFYVAPGLAQASMSPYAYLLTLEQKD